MYTLTEVARLLNLKIRTVYQWVHDGKIKVVKGGIDKRRLYVTQDEVERLMRKTYEKDL